LIREILHFENVSKFTPPHNLFNINLDINEGEIFAIIEQSGQSFETLIQLITGELSPDVGHIYVEDREITEFDPVRMKILGMYCIRGSSQLMPKLSIAENICTLTNLQSGNRFISHWKNGARARELLNEYGLSFLNENDNVSKLPESLCYMVEILRCHMAGVRLLIIGNIFSSFSHHEYGLLISILKKIVINGTSVVIFTNEPSEISSVADRIDIIRQKTVASHLRKPLPGKDAIKFLMAGPSASSEAIPDYFEDANVALSVNYRDNMYFQNSARLNIKKGKISGLIDLSGSRSGYDGSKIVFSPAAGSGDSSEIFVVPPIKNRDYVFHNLSLMDNVTINLPGSAKTFFGGCSLPIRRYLYKNALEAIQCGEIDKIFGKETTLPQVDKPMQLQILTARAVCSGASVFVYIEPFESMSLPEFESLLDCVSKLGVTVLVVSSSYFSLSEVCSDIYTFEDNVIKRAENTPFTAG